MSENKKITAQMLKPGMVVETKRGLKFEIQQVVSEVKVWVVESKYDAPRVDGIFQVIEVYIEDIKEILSTPATDIDVGAKIQSKKMIDGDELTKYIDDHIENRISKLEAKEGAFAFYEIQLAKKIIDKILEMQKENESKN